MLGGLGLLLATVGTSPARAACSVDSLSTRVQLTKGRRVDVLRLYVDSGAVDCGSLRLSAPGAGEVVDARAKVIRGDAPNQRFGRDHLVDAAEDGTLVSRFILPGLRQRDIVVLTVERRLDEGFTWQPATWGTPDWAELKVRGAGEPSLSEVDFDGRAWFVEGPAIEAAGGTVTVRFGPEPPAMPTWSQEGVARVRIELEPEPAPPPGEPPLGQSTITWTLPIGRSGAHAVAWPAGSSNRSCRVVGDAEALILPTDAGCAVSEAAADSALQAQWTVPRVILAGELGPQVRGAPSESPTHMDLSPIFTAVPSVSAPLLGASFDAGGSPSTQLGPTGRIDLEVVGKGVSFAGEVRHTGRAETMAGDQRLLLTLPEWGGGGAGAVPPQAGWWVTGVHGQPLLSDREAVVEVVARTALAASLPEPGLPARLRLRSGEEESIPEVRRLLRSQVREGRLPGRRSLQPRRLLGVRKSSYGTEWEQALILARYLRQLRIDAVPVPVRLPGHAEGSPGAPIGYDHAVVRLELDEGRVWLDPSCPVCALGELRPELWGGRVLDAELERLPDAPGGQLVESVEVAGNGQETITWRLSGDAALALRRSLLRVPTSERGEALGELFEGTVRSHAGLGEPGAEIEVVVERAGVFDERPPSERLVVPDGEVLRVPWVGTLTRQLRVSPDAPGVLLAGAGDARVDGAGLVWSRSLGTEGNGTRVAHEELKVERPVILRADLLALQLRMAPAAKPVRLEPPAPTSSSDLDTVAPPSSD